MSRNKPDPRTVAETEKAAVEKTSIRRAGHHPEDHRTTSHPAPGRKLRLPAYVRHA